MDPTYRQAVIDHFIRNYRQTNNPHAFAKMRMGEIQELFRALDEQDKPRERPESDRTKEVRVTLEKLNDKGEG